MCTTKTSDTVATARQIRALADEGCEIVRVSVLDEADALAIKELKSLSPLPVVADIHFSHKLAVKAIESGCDKVLLAAFSVMLKVCGAIVQPLGEKVNYSLFADLSKDVEYLIAGILTVAFMYLLVVMLIINSANSFI